MNETINYYNEFAHEFSKSTCNVDMSGVYNHFLPRIGKNGKILDVGCGPGRDSKYFLKLGYQVKSIDASIGMCQIGKANSIDIELMNILDIEFQNEFDGVWACANLLHLKREDLPTAFTKIQQALKPGGIFYASFKYGEFSGLRNSRFFTDMNTELLHDLVNKVEDLSIIDEFITGDVRAGRESEKWLNVILMKSN